jgi:hypothetical protein
MQQNIKCNFMVGTGMLALVLVLPTDRHRRGTMEKMSNWTRKITRAMPKSVTWRYHRVSSFLQTITRIFSETLVWLTISASLSARNT